MAIDPALDPYTLAGRVVTMGDAGVIDDGRVHVNHGRIEAVGSGADAPPAGFGSAPLVTTGGTIYPGLIELHNHLAYNAMPLWDVPTRYSNNGQWRGIDPYKRRITKPSQVLGQTPSVIPALLRYVECRALLGGVTTSQGITLAGSGAINRYYTGLVRNVEQPLDQELPAADTNIANPSTDGATAYLAKLATKSCYLQHLSEGSDATARGWFLRLRLPGGGWAITPALCAIHAAALGRDDFGALVAGGASMVWSPLSNYLLYGATADLRAAKDAGILMGLGSDWAPSGSKNLLGELKVALLASDLQGGVFTPQELVSMVTSNAARIVKWDEQLGTLEEGRRADIVVVLGRSGDPYRTLIEAHESSIALVAIEGIPRLGQARLMTRFAGSHEVIRVGSSERYLALDDPAADPLVRGITLAAATATLRDALARLPELARQVDSASADGLFAGAADDAGIAWRVVPDFEADDFARGIDVASEPYADWVEPMTLDPITLSGDPGHLAALLASRNLPEAIRRGLPALFGKSVREATPLPHGAGFVAVPGQDIASVVAETTTDLAATLRAFGELTLEGRLRIVDEALLLFQEHYVHLPLKRAMHAVDPVQRLRLLRRRLERLTEAASPEGGGPLLPPEIEFHAELLDIFNSVRDLHTTYGLPAPFATKVAWLPFLIEECTDAGTPRYLVTKILPDAGPADLVPGVEVTHWNGMSMRAAVARNGERQAGSNPDARHARGLHSLTIRPLGHGLPPDEEWVTLRFRPLASGDTLAAPVEHTQRWLVFEPGAASTVGPALLSAAGTAVGIDARTDAVQQVRKLLYAPAVARAEVSAQSQRLARPMPNASGILETTMPGVLRATLVRASDAGPDGTEYGWLRIFTFNVPDADSFVAEVVRLLEQLPSSGLVIDVRGNGGGLILAAEGILQTLASRRIEPERAQFLTSALNLRLCRRHARSERFPDLVLEPWVASLANAVETGSAYSAGFPISSVDACNSVGQRYFGPVALVTDPLCYSATDMFAAGFQDHAIGPVIGVGGATGAGGANVWPHELLRALLEPDQADPAPSPYAALPGGAELRVAIRRTVRSGDDPGDILEDLGVTPDIPYRMTRADLLRGNRDLQDRAIAAIAIRRAHGMTVEVVTRPGHLPRLVLRTSHIDRLDAAVRIADASGHVDARDSGRRFPTTDIRADHAVLDLDGVLQRGTTGTLEVEVLGHDGMQLAIRRLVRLELE